MLPHKWTVDEERKLREVYPLMPNREIAKIFRVSRIAINHKTERLGLNQSQKTYRIREVVCDYCGNVLKKRLSQTAGSHHFCSPKCYAEWRSEHAFKIQPKLSSSPSLAYVCGVLLGDGVCCKSSQGRNKNAVVYVVALEVTEKRFALSFMEALQCLGMHSRIYFNKKKGNRRDTYYVKAYSKRFYQWWTKQTLADFERTFFDEATLLKEFVRGFFESEGSYYDRDYPYYQTFCLMVNTEQTIIHLFEKALSQLSFKTSIHRHEEKRKDRKRFVYKLWILGGKSEHNRFIELIKPCIKNHLH
jgi:intein-encoded DNA endonuclease-like protein